MYVITFFILVFRLLDNSANKHAEQPRFFSCFTSGSCTIAKYTKLCIVWQPNIRNMLYPLFQILARPLLATSVTSRSSVETAEQIELVFGTATSFHLSHTVLKENSGISKNRGIFPSRILSETPDLENSASA